MCKKNIFFIILIVISISIIFFRFPQIPKNLSYDEIDFARLALSLESSNYIPYSPLATGHATLYFYHILASLKLFGISIFALRIPSAVYGVLGSIVFYLMINLIFQQKPKKANLLDILLPFLLSLAFVTSRWYFNFSRFSFEATFLIFLELSSLYWLFCYLNKQKKLRFLIMSGLFAGLAFNSYTPGRVFFIVPLFGIFMSYLHELELSRYNIVQIVIHLIQYKFLKIFLFFIIPFIITIIPLSFYILTHQDDRFDKQFYPKNTEMSLIEKADFFSRNVTSLALMFQVKGDINGRHNYPGKPALNPIIGTLFIIGLILAIKNFKEINNQIFLFYFLIASLPMLLTYPWENPNMLRTITTIPSIIYFVGFALVRIINKIQISKKILITGLCIFFILSALYEIRTYFVFQTPVFSDAFEAPLTLQDALQLKPNSK